MPDGRWQTPYGAVTRPRGGRGDEAYLDYWRQRMGYQRPVAAQFAPAPPEMYGWQPSPAMMASIPPQYQQYQGQPPIGAPADTHPAWFQGQPPISTPGVPTDVLPAWFTGAPGAPVTPPSQAGAPSNAYLPLRMQGPWPGGAPAAPTQAPPGAGGSAAAGAPAATGGFGPFGSIEEWRNQFHQEHGRWPTDTDAQDAIASFGFLGQTGRSPTQQEWESRWQGGYGGTPQWGPMGGGGYGGGGGGWGAPPQPSWWGGEVLGEEGWTYLPTEMGKWPDKPPERGEQHLPDWYDIKNIRSFQQVPPQWRDWVQQVMQSQQQYWENPLMAPIQWATPAQTEL